MNRALSAAIVAALGAATSASASVVLMEDSYSDIRLWPDWILASRDTSAFAQGTASLLVTNVGAKEPWFRLVVGMETSLLADDVIPADATISFKYKADADTPISLGLQNGTWGNVTISGSTTLIGDGTWRDATISLSGGWIGTPPASGTPLTHMRIERPEAVFWGQGPLTANLDSFVYAVPEPTSLALLAVAGMLALRRRA